MFFKMIGEKENETTVWRRLNNNKTELRLEVREERREESKCGESTMETLSAFKNSQKEKC